MEEFQLSFNNQVLALEKANRWKTLVDVVFNQWEENPNQIKLLLCAGTQLWYTILEMEYIKNHPSPPSDIEYVSNEYLQYRLTIVTRYGFKHFRDNPLFNSYFGYMISVMPYYFLDYNGDYSGWKTKGIEMMRRSYKLDPDSPFTKAMYHLTNGYTRNTPFYDACKEIWKIIPTQEWGECGVQQYFFCILNGNTLGDKG